MADRFLKINTSSELKKDAVYIFDIETFFNKIGLTKKELISDIPRIFHSRGWEEKVDEIANRKTNDRLVDNAYNYVKKKR